MMRLGFKKPQPKSFWQKMIAWKTNSPYAHVELFFSNGQSFSASEYDKGIRFKSAEEVLASSEWDFIDLPELDSYEPTCYEWARRADGLPYDWSEITSFVIARQRDNPNEYICSTASLLPLKLGAQVLADCKFPFFSPYDLYVGISAWKSARQWKG